MELSKYFDHTNLNPNAVESDIIKLVDEAKKLNVKSICVNPSFVKLAHELLKDSDVEVCTVVGFPLGQNTTATKVFETKDAIENGADEIDMVINVGKLIQGDTEYVSNEIKNIKKVCGERILKCIIETALLTDEEILLASKIVLESGADFVKTSTGFSTRGASVHDILLIKSVVSGECGIKAAGGIRDKKFAMDLIEAGATRIGASKSSSTLAQN